MSFVGPTHAETELVPGETDIFVVPGTLTTTIPEPPGTAEQVAESLFPPPPPPLFAVAGCAAVRFEAPLAPPKFKPFPD